MRRSSLTLLLLVALLPAGVLGQSMTTGRGVESVYQGAGTARSGPDSMRFHMFFPSCLADGVTDIRMYWDIDTTTVFGSFSLPAEYARQVPGILRAVAGDPLPLPSPSPGPPGWWPTELREDLRRGKLEAAGYRLFWCHGGWRGYTLAIKLEEGTAYYWRGK